MVDRPLDSRHGCRDEHVDGIIRLHAGLKPVVKGIGNRLSQLFLKTGIEINHTGINVQQSSQFGLVLANEGDPLNGTGPI